ncbi:MAG: type II secretion system secretin GspD [Burkholderiaceae bacterium]
MEHKINPACIATTGMAHIARAGWAVALTVTVMVVALTMPQPASAQPGEPVTLNFRDAEIDTVIGAFGHLLDRTFIIDPRVRGKITVETPNPLSRADAYKLLLAALRLQGFTIVSSGRIAKVVPEADAKLQSGPVTAGRQPPEGGDVIVTQIFRLNYESATNLVPVLRPLIAPNNTISAYPNNNSLVITDYATNLQRVARIIATLDSPSTREVEVLQVQYGLASDIAVMLTRLLDDTQRAGQGAQVDAGQRVVVIADPNSNTIMLRAANPAKVNLAKQLLIRLDQPSKNPGNIRVVYLRNANAVELANTLQAVLSGSSSGGAAGLVNQTNRATSALTNRNGANNRNGARAAAAPASQSAVTVSAGGATIAADPTTNSLIITAPDAVYRNLRTVIDKLDTRRAQVYIESLIVEVSAEKAAEFGIQWQFLDVNGNNVRAIGGTNFTNLDGGGSILQASQNLAAAGGGINFGIVNGTTTIPGVNGGTEILNLPLLARALESNAGANILATPNLLTMDNEEARIVIGQNVPFVTGQFTNTGTSNASVNPFQTIERKDVGTTLRVRPQVSESGVIKLEIFQEVSSVQASAVASDIITNRRAIETNVLVDNGQIVVLGGLIEERIEGGESKVPVLGDIPFLGALFRYDSRRRTKTNLLVFLRPTIVRDAQAAYGVTSSRYDYMRQLRDENSLPAHWLLPDMKPTEMTAMPPAPPRTDPNAPIDREVPAAKPAFDVRTDTTMSPEVQRQMNLRRSGVEQPLHLLNETPPARAGRGRVTDGSTPGQAASNPVQPVVPSDRVEPPETDINF